MLTINGILLKKCVQVDHSTDTAGLDSIREHDISCNDEVEEHLDHADDDEREQNDSSSDEAEEHLDSADDEREQNSQNEDDENEDHVQTVNMLIFY